MPSSSATDTIFPKFDQRFCGIKMGFLLQTSYSAFPRIKELDCPQGKISNETSSSVNINGKLKAGLTSTIFPGVENEIGGEKYGAKSAASSIIFLSFFPLHSVCHHDCFYSHAPKERHESILRKDGGKPLVRPLVLKNLFVEIMFNILF